MMEGQYGECYDPVADIPAMTPESVHKALTGYGAAWSGRGVAVECGSWLGATCAALCLGLEKAGYDRSVYCYDRWKANAEEVEKARAQGQDIEVGQNLAPIFRANVRRATNINIWTNRIAQIHMATWHDRLPIEIFLLDAAKSSPGFERTLDVFGPYWVPGAVVGLLDFYFARKMGRRPNQEQFVEAHGDAFELIQDFDGCSSAFFRYRGGLWS